MRLSALAFCLLPAAAPAADLTPMERLGRSIFFDPALSVTGTMACASCHDPAAGFSSPDAAANLTGAVVPGAVPGRAGNRKPPSAAYAAFSPVFHHVAEDDDVIFAGGTFLDGRAKGHRLGSALAEQAQGPFTNPLEMALPDPACVVARVLSPARPEDYPVSFTQVFGPEAAAVDLPEGLATLCADPGSWIVLPDGAAQEQVEAAFDRIGLAVAAFEASAEVNRFTSRFDKWQRGEGRLSAKELAGLALFADEKKGNCAACHLLTPNSAGGPAVFTDWTFDNLGVPRNRDNPFYTQPGNAAGAGYVDPGLGATLAADPVYAPFAAANLGKQQVPTLRNLAAGGSGIPHAYMHNGYFKSLAGVVHFYNTRDVLPTCADPLATEAEALAQGCWPPAEVAGNVNGDELGNLGLSAAEEDEIVAFLRTLDDE